MTTATRTTRSGLRVRWIVVLAGLLTVTLVALGVYAIARSEPAVVAVDTGVPAAPPTVTATPGNASATVHWTIPAANDSAITHYVVTPYIGSHVRPSITVGVVTAVKVTGLTNSNSYTFQVAAQNARGTGPQGSSPVITIGAPLPPTGVNAQFGNGSFTVHWKAPAINNGSPITGYIVTPYMHGVELAARSFASGSSSGTMTGLTAGTTYAFRVAAKNANGPGPGSRPSKAVLRPCVGVPMTAGQADIDAHGTGTTFCLSGTHNWTLTPKAGDELIGPATLDGGNATAHAIVATAPNVTLVSLAIQHYDNGNGTQDGAIHIDDNDAAKATASGWRLMNMNVGFNSASGSGTGDNWTFLAGRFHDNRQEGLGGAVGTGVTVNGVEIDHNNFTDTTYKTRNWSCGDEAGGFKWVTDNVTVENSSIHDNACKGLWADLNGNNAVITHNQVYNNWDEGIFIEISSGAKIFDNTVRNNGFRGGIGCKWLWDGGITLASSDHAVVAQNVLTGNCNGITGTQQDRPEGKPGLLEHITVRDNYVSGSGRTGVAADNGADLTTRNIVFTDNRFGARTAPLLPALLTPSLNRALLDR